MNENHPCKRVKVDEDEALQNSKDVTNLLVKKFSITMEPTCWYDSCTNVRNYQHNIILYNMFILGFTDSHKQ